MRQNLHTHTLQCDGKNTPDEMALRAIELGFDSLGYSSHAKTKFNTDWELGCTENEYVSKIKELKAKYIDEIDIFLGVELDYYSAGFMSCKEYDYFIGSVHMTVEDGALVDFDLSYESSLKYIRESYGGDSDRFVRAYYEKVAEMPSVMDYDIVGHFDLVTKFSEKHPDLIDLDSLKYKSYALEALHAVRERRELFEINTGAIGRGYKKTPYPAPFILDEMKKLNCKLILTSDCHNKDFLDAGFDEALEYIRARGFDSLVYLTDGGFIEEKI